MDSIRVALQNYFFFAIPPLSGQFYPPRITWVRVMKFTRELALRYNNDFAGQPALELSFVACIHESVVPTGKFAREIVLHHVTGIFTGRQN